MQVRQQLGRHRRPTHRGAGERLGARWSAPLDERDLARDARSVGLALGRWRGDEPEPTPAANGLGPSPHPSWSLRYLPEELRKSLCLLDVRTATGHCEVIEHRYESGDLHEISTWWQERMRQSVQDLPSAWVERAFSKLTRRELQV